MELNSIIFPSPPCNWGPEDFEGKIIYIPESLEDLDKRRLKYAAQKRISRDLLKEQLVHQDRNRDFVSRPSLQNPRLMNTFKNISGDDEAP